MIKIIKLNKFILILIIIFACAAGSCGDNKAPDGGEKNNAAADPGAAGDDGEGADIIQENIYEIFPKNDFGGREFAMVIADYMQEEHYSESEIGEVFNDAVYNRNKKIEDDFNIDFKFRILPHGDGPADIRKSVMAGDKAYDLGALHAVSAAGFIGNNIYENWRIVPVIKENLGNPWWSASVTNDMSINGKSFFIAGDIGYIFTAHTHALLFNKKLFADAGMDYPYETVKNGGWTFEFFETLTKDANLDLNGDGDLNIRDDRFGFTTMGLFGDVMYFFSFGGKIIEKGKDDLPVLVLDSERNMRIVETGYRWFIENNSPVVQYTGDDDYSKELTHIAFNQDRAYFLGTNLKNLRVFRNMESEYGIVPFPKLDDAQENYISVVDGAATMLVLPKGADAEISGVIAEAMARESSVSVIPAYYDSTLQLKFTRDEDTKEMLGIIKDTAYFDMGYIYNFAGSGFVSKTLLDQKSTNLASFCEKNAGQIEKAIARLIENCAEDE